MTRINNLMQGIQKAEKLIEIGPSLNPLAPKADGWYSFSIDHADQAGLRAKYKDDPRVDGSKIERVDFVWTSGSLSNAVPAEHLHTFDVFLASHVIEHYPDVVDFLTSADRLTKPQGRMVLAVPDKRLCFDMFRSVSSTGEAVSAHLEKRSRHTLANVFDFASKAVTKNGLPGWLVTNSTPPQPMTVELEVVHTHALATRLAGYIDAHAWVFCPASFELMMMELARLGYTDWRVERCEAQPETEFFAWLVKGGKQHYQSMSHTDLYDIRQALMKRTLVELAEQLHTIVVDDIIANYQGVNGLTTKPPALAAAEQKASALLAELNLIKGSRVWRLRTAISNLLSPKPIATPAATPATAIQEAAQEEATKPAVDTLDQYVTTLPTEQNAFDLFKTEWTSTVPVPNVVSGHAALFEDGRIPWFLNQIGDCTGYRALELGPLEAGHTHMLEKSAVKSVVAVEANQRAFLKCLIVQNALDMRKAHFLLGDFQEYLAAAAPASFEITIASGVLYHMRDPVSLIKNLCRVNTKAILLWTHYYDAELIRQNLAVVTSKFGDTVKSNVDGVEIESTEFLYQTSLEWSGFCGGSKHSAQWLRRQDIMNLFELYGWEMKAISNDDTQHPHGPAFTLCFVKKVV